MRAACEVCGVVRLARSIPTVPPPAPSPVGLKTGGSSSSSSTGSTSASVSGSSSGSRQGAPALSERVDRAAMARRKNDAIRQFGDWARGQEDDIVSLQYADEEFLHLRLDHAHQFRLRYPQGPKQIFIVDQADATLHDNGFFSNYNSLLLELVASRGSPSRVSFADVLTMAANCHRRIGTVSSSLQPGSVGTDDGVDGVDAGEGGAEDSADGGCTDAEFKEQVAGDATLDEGLADTPMRGEDEEEGDGVEHKGHTSAATVADAATDSATVASDDGWNQLADEWDAMIESAPKEQLETRMRQKLLRRIGQFCRKVGAPKVAYERMDRTTIAHTFVQVKMTRHETGMDVHYRTSNPLMWTVELHPPIFVNRPLHDDLKRLKSMRHPDYLELQVTFDPIRYWSYPPVVRLLRPRLSGRLLEELQLSPSMWNPVHGLQPALQGICGLLSDKGRVDFEYAMRQNANVASSVSHGHFERVTDEDQDLDMMPAEASTANVSAKRLELHSKEAAALVTYLARRDAAQRARQQHLQEHQSMAARATAATTSTTAFPHHDAIDVFRETRRLRHQQLSVGGTGGAAASASDAGDEELQMAIARSLSSAQFFPSRHLEPDESLASAALASSRRSVLLQTFGKRKAEYSELEYALPRLASLVQRTIGSPELDDASGPSGSSERKRPAHARQLRRDAVPQRSQRLAGSERVKLERFRAEQIREELLTVASVLDVSILSAMNVELLIGSHLPLVLVHALTSATYDGWSLRPERARVTDDGGSHDQQANAWTLAWKPSPPPIWFDWSLYPAADAAIVVAFRLSRHRLTSLLTGPVAVTGTPYSTTVERALRGLLAQTRTLYLPSWTSVTAQVHKDVLVQALNNIKTCRAMGFDHRHGETSLLRDSQVPTIGGAKLDDLTTERRLSPRLVGWPEKAILRWRRGAIGKSPVAQRPTDRAHLFAALRLWYKALSESAQTRSWKLQVLDSDARRWQLDIPSLNAQHHVRTTQHTLRLHIRFHTFQDMLFLPEIQVAWPPLAIDEPRNLNILRSVVMMCMEMPMNVDAGDDWLTARLERQVLPQLMQLVPAGPRAYAADESNMLCPITLMTQACLAIQWTENQEHLWSKHCTDSWQTLLTEQWAHLRDLLRSFVKTHDARTVKVPADKYRMPARELLERRVAALTTTTISSTDDDDDADDDDDVATAMACAEGMAVAPAAGPSPEDLIRQAEAMLIERDDGDTLMDTGRHCDSLRCEIRFGKLFDYGSRLIPTIVGVGAARAMAMPAVMGAPLPGAWLSGCASLARQALRLADIDPTASFDSDGKVDRSALRFPNPLLLRGRGLQLKRWHILMSLAQAPNHRPWLSHFTGKMLQMKQAGRYQALARAIHLMHSTHSASPRVSSSSSSATASAYTATDTAPTGAAASSSSMDAADVQRLTDAKRALEIAGLPELLALRLRRRGMIPQSTYRLTLYVCETLHRCRELRPLLYQPLYSSSTLSATASATSNATGSGGWRIVTVDDDLDVHQSTVRRDLREVAASDKNTPSTLTLCLADLLYKLVLHYQVVEVARTCKDAPSLASLNPLDVLRLLLVASMVCGPLTACGVSPTDFQSFALAREHGSPRPCTCDDAESITASTSTGVVGTLQQHHHALGSFAAGEMPGLCKTGLRSDHYRYVETKSDDQDEDVSMMPGPWEETLNDQSRDASPALSDGGSGSSSSSSNASASSTGTASSTADAVASGDGGSGGSGGSRGSGGSSSAAVTTVVSTTTAESMDSISLPGKLEPVKHWDSLPIDGLQHSMVPAMLALPPSTLGRLARRHLQQSQSNRSSRVAPTAAGQLAQATENEAATVIREWDEIETLLALRHALRQHATQWLEQYVCKPSKSFGLVKRLVSAGVCARNSLLHMLDHDRCVFGETSTALDVIEMLIDAKADVNAQHPESGVTPLMAAMHHSTAAVGNEHDRAWWQAAVMALVRAGAHYQVMHRGRLLFDLEQARVTGGSGALVDTISYAIPNKDRRLTFARVIKHSTTLSPFFAQAKFDVKNMFRTIYSFL